MHSTRIKGSQLPWGKDLPSWSTLLHRLLLLPFLRSQLLHTPFQVGEQITCLRGLGQLSLVSFYVFRNLLSVWVDLVDIYHIVMSLLSALKWSPTKSPSTRPYQSSNGLTKANAPMFLLPIFSLNTINTPEISYFVQPLIPLYAY